MADENKTPPCPAGDELQAGPDLGNGARPFVRHTADHKIVVGIMTPAQEGQPIMTEGAFALEPIEGTDRFKVEEVSIPGSGTKGPAKVNSRAFRENFDSIFGKRLTVGEA